MNSLKIQNLSAQVNDLVLLNHIDLTINPGELVVILGSNGAGKSTLLKCLTGLQTCNADAVRWGDQELQDLDNASRAKILSYLPQERPTSWPLRVKDVVALGRYSYGVGAGQLTPENKAAINRAISACHLTQLQDRSINTLSGGEQARVHLARTFAAEAPLLIADEPTTSLDPRHQLEIMMLLHEYVGEHRAALIVLHEPELAARFADRLIWMKSGKIIADGTPKATLTPETLNQVYDVEAQVDLERETPSVHFIGPA